MAKAGQILEIENSGIKTVITKSAKDTQGAMAQMESVMQPGKKLPTLPHYHPSQEEKLEVISGEVTVLLDGETTKLRSGEMIVFPKGKVHNFWNEGTVAAQYRVEHTPALEIQHFIETLVALAKHGKLKYDDSFFDKMQMAVVVEYYKRTLQIPMPLKLGIKILAFVGRVSGMKGYTPEYFVE